MAKWMDSMFGGGGGGSAPKASGRGGAGVGIEAAQGVNELRQAFENLRTVLLEMLDAQVRGQPVDLISPAMRQFLHLSESADLEEAMRRLRVINAPIVGQVPCGECGAVIDRREGLDEVVCAWCGATVAFGAASDEAVADVQDTD